MIEPGKAPKAHEPLADWPLFLPMRTRAGRMFWPMARKRGKVELDLSACRVLLSAEGDQLSGGGNTFDCYSAGGITDTDLPLAGTGLSSIVTGDSPYGAINGDAFDSYDAQDPITQTLDAGVGIGAWTHGDGPE